MAAPSKNRILKTNRARKLIATRRTDAHFVIYFKFKKTFSAALRGIRAGPSIFSAPLAPAPATDDAMLVRFSTAFFHSLSATLFPNHYGKADRSCCGGGAGGFVDFHSRIFLHAILQIFVESLRYRVAHPPPPSPAISGNL